MLDYKREEHEDVGEKIPFKYNKSIINDARLNLQKQLCLIFAEDEQDAVVSELEQKLLD